MAGQNSERNPVVLAGSAFALGVVVGLVLKDLVTQLVERARVSQWHWDYERTELYDENLPETLGRRESAPESGQPRYGGTGALGVHPAAASTASEEKSG